MLLVTQFSRIQNNIDTEHTHNVQKSVAYFSYHRPITLLKSFHATTKVDIKRELTFQFFQFCSSFFKQLIQCIRARLKKINQILATTWSITLIIGQPQLSFQIGFFHCAAGVPCSEKSSQIRFIFGKTSYRGNFARKIFFLEKKKEHITSF